MTTKVSSLVLANTAVTAGTYGGTTQIPVITVDPQGRTILASNVSVSGISVATTQLTGTITSAQLASGAAVTNIGYTPYNNTNPSGYITGITSSNVTTALGFTPYNATNPNGYITGITSANVTGALGFTPYNATNPSGYVTSTGSVNYATSAGSATTAGNGVANFNTYSYQNYEYFSYNTPDGTAYAYGNVTHTAHRITLSNGTIFDIYVS